MITTLWNTKTYSLAQENMDADIELKESCSKIKRLVRCYKWENPSITYGYKQKVPTALTHIDGGRRATGGGIVFHNPGDIVIACAAPINDPLFTGKLREKMTIISVLLKNTFKTLGISLNPRPKPKHIKLEDFEEKAFCNTYINPFEWYYNNEKIIAITCRSYRNVILVQCILHLYDNNKTFQNLSEFSSVFSGGLPSSIRPHFNELHTVLNKQIVRL